MRSLRTGWACVVLSIAPFAACGNDTSGESSDAVSSNLNPAAVRTILENGARGPNRCSFLTDAQAQRLVEVAGETVERILDDELGRDEARVYSYCDLVLGGIASAKPSVAVYHKPFPFGEDSFEGFDRVGQFGYLNDDDSELDWGAYYLENDVLVSVRTGPSDIVDLDETVAMLDELLTILEDESASDREASSG